MLTLIHSISVTALLGAFVACAVAGPITFTFSTINDPLSNGTMQVYGINDIGQMSGYYTDNSGDHGFLYSGGSFTPIDVPGAVSTEGVGLDNAGEIVGIYYDGSGGHGFMDIGGTFTALDDPVASASGNVCNIGGRLIPCALTGAYGINSAGQIVGAFQDGNAGPGRVSAFLRDSDGHYITIDDPLATVVTVAYGINSSGQVVGTYYSGAGGSHGFVRNSDGDYTTIDDPAAGSSGSTQAEGINDAGQIVGSYNDGTSIYGFVYSNGIFTNFADPLVIYQNVYQNLDLVTWGTAINNNTQVAGYYAAGSVEYGYFATPTPEPATLPLTFIVSAIAGYRLRMQSKVRRNRSL